MEKILAALLKLDVNNDAHWTTDGLPKIEMVRMLAANPTLTRAELTDASPEFTRQKVKAAPPVPPVPPVPPSPAENMVATPPKQTMLASAEDKPVEGDPALTTVVNESPSHVLAIEQEKLAEMQVWLARPPSSAMR